MTLPLACADFTFPLLAHEKVLDLIALLEFDGVDIGLFEGRSHLQPNDQFKNVAESSRRLAQSVHDRGLKVADIFLQTAPDFESLAPNHPDRKRRQQARDLFERALEYASGCGSRHVSALPGVLFPEENSAHSWKRGVDELAWRVERACASDLTFAIEAHVGSLVPTPEEALRLVQEVPGLTLTVDYTHFAKLGIADGRVEPMLEYASHFHVRGASLGRLQTSFTRNTIDYARVVSMLESQGYSGYLGVEYVWIDWEQCNEVDNLSETIQWRDYLRKLMA